jgi:hypothetical protein
VQKKLTLNRIITHITIFFVLSFINFILECKRLELDSISRRLQQFSPFRDWSMFLEAVDVIVLRSIMGDRYSAIYKMIDFWL